MTDVQPLGSILTVTKGKRPKRLSDTPKPGYVPYLDIAAIEQGNKRQWADPNEAHLVPAGQLVMVWDGARSGWSALAPFAGALGSTLAALDSPLQPSYLRAVLSYYFGAINSNHRGSGIPHVNPDFLRALDCPVPSPGQQRALSQLQIDMEKRERDASGHITSAVTTVNRFKQAVLAAAWSGRLTADWREAHPTTTAELSPPLPIQSWGARHGGVVAEPSLLPDLPESWIPATLGSLVERIEAGKSFNALGRPASPAEWGVIKVSAMSWGNFREQENKALQSHQLPNRRHEVKEGDLLISRANTVDLVGATVLVGKCRPRLLLSDKSLRLVPCSGIAKGWLNYTLRAPASRLQFADRATGTSDSMRNLSQVKILATTLPLPPLDEQQEIARRIDMLYQRIDQLEGRVEGAAHRVAATSQAVLAKSLHGELVGEAS